MALEGAGEQLTVLLLDNLQRPVAQEGQKPGKV
jgi:hypothetical protein